MLVYVLKIIPSFLVLDRLAPGRPLSCTSPDTSANNTKYAPAYYKNYEKCHNYAKSSPGFWGSNKHLTFPENMFNNLLWVTNVL